MAFTVTFEKVACDWFEHAYVVQKLWEKRYDPKKRDFGRSCFSARKRRYLSFSKWNLGEGEGEAEQLHVMAKNHSHQFQNGGGYGWKRNNAKYEKREDPRTPKLT